MKLSESQKAKIHRILDIIDEAIMEFPEKQDESTPAYFQEGYNTKEVDDWLRKWFNVKR